MAELIKVMIVDDSAVVRETIGRLLIDSGDFEVVATASDPYIAAKKLQTVVPDVITLDIEMPRMDGLRFLRHLMQQHPLPVVICSSVAESGSANAVAALESGAVDIIEKPRVGTKEFLEESRVKVCDAVRAAYESRHRFGKGGASRSASTSAAGAAAPTSPAPPRPARAARAHALNSMGEIEPKHSADVIIASPTPGKSNVPVTTEKVVVMGASTGGTEALREVLERMPLDSPGIVIVQHMPEKFTEAFARRLDSLCEITVQEARDNDTVVTGRALIAPGNKHMLLKRSGARYYVEVRDGPLVSRHRPSVDVLFRSAARYAGPNAIGVIMTGMGDDGARGMREMHDAGAYCFAQDQATCVVYGMPNEAVKHGGVDESIPLGAVAERVMRRVGRSARVSSHS